MDKIQAAKSRVYWICKHIEKEFSHRVTYVCVDLVIYDTERDGNKSEKEFIGG
jgi:hypothetical protein